MPQVTNHISITGAQPRLQKVLLFSLKLAVLSAVVMVGMSIFKPKPAAALTPRDIPADIRASIATYEGACAGMAEKYFLVDWISPRGDSTNRGPVSVSPGTSVVPLQINYLIFVCHDQTNYSGGTWGYLGDVGLPDDLQTPGASLTQDYRWKSNSWATPDGVVSPNLIGDAYNVGIGKDANSRYWFGYQFFDYVSPSPMYRSKNITVNLTVHEWLTYHNNWGNTWCAMPPGQTQRISGGAAPFGCPGGNVTYPMLINVTGWGALGVLDKIDCPLGFKGWALDLDSPSTSIPVHIYADAPAGSPGAKFVGAYMADQPRPDVNSILSGATGITITGNHGFVIPPGSIPAQFKTGARTFYLYAIGVDGSGNIDGLNPQIATQTTNFTVCGGGTSTPFTLTPVAQTPTSEDDESVGGQTYHSYVTGSTGIPSAGVQATVTRTITYHRGSSSTPYINLIPPITETRRFGSGQTPNPPYEDFTYAAPPGGWQAGDQYCVLMTVSPAAGNIDGSGNVTAVTTPSAASGTPAGTPTCARVSNKPYVQFYGNDVRSGAGFIKSDGTCDQSTGNIKTFNKVWVDVGWIGSGVQFAAFARGAIDGFMTVSVRNPSLVDPLAPVGLSFANNNVGNVHTDLAGNFGANSCLPDYFSGKPTTPPGNTDVYTIPTTATQESTYIKPSAPYTTTLGLLGGSYGPGARKALYVDGDVFILGNITYSGTWTKREDIPAIYIIAKGNIYI